MSEWWTYRPDDFLLFSPRVYWRMFELHNASLWPWHILTLAFGLTALIVALRRSRQHDRWIALIVAVAWAFVGWWFLWNRYATINWAIAYLVPVFALQAALLLVAGMLFDGFVADRGRIGGWIGLLLVLIALLGYPLLAPLGGRAWSSAEVFGIAPDPTAVATLGFLLAASGRLQPVLFPIPLMWCLFSGLTLWMMSDSQAWALVLAAVVTLTILALRALRRTPKGG
jgi:Family of unknown function (DUF6064)